MNIDNEEAGNDDSPSTPGDGEVKSEGGAAPDGRGQAEPPDEEERQRLGREAMDRWMLHETFMKDFAEEPEAEDTPSSPPEGR